MALEQSKTLENYFDKIAANYQFMNSLLSLNLDRYWRDKLLKRTRLKEGSFFLDVACGTCDIAQLIEKDYSNRSINVHGVGLDLSFGMLEVAKQNEALGLLVRGNGISTPFPEASFDLITISFGYRNMPSHQEFLKEAYRLLKPGGQLLVLELTRPKNPVLNFGNTIYLNTILPLVSQFFGRDREAYRYLARSIQAFPHQDKVQLNFEQEGFQSCSYELLNGGITTLFEGSKPV